MSWPAHLAVDGSSWGEEERGVAIATRRLWSAVTGDVALAESIRTGEASVASVLRPAGGKLNGIRRVAWQQLALPGLTRKRGVDLLYCPSYTAPLAVSCRLVVTVHDLIAWTHPWLAGWRNALHLRLLAGHGLRRADAICVPTESVRRALVDRFPVRSDRVFVVPWGSDAEIVPLTREAAKEKIRRRFSIGESFVLFCGCLEPKKNLPAAIRACAEAGLLLVVVGPWIAGSADQLSGKSAAGPRPWRYLGYVSTAELNALYCCATALLYPSIVEGFGLPVIEAMRCRCPVITSTSEAVREVSGGAAIHVPPEDVAGMAASLRLVAGDPACREEMVGRGVERAAHFTWQKAADRFREVLHVATR